MDPAAEPYRTLARLEESPWRAKTRGNRSLMEDTFTADLFEFGRSGRGWRRSDMLLDHSSPIAATLPLQNLRIIHLDGATALVTYDSIVEHEQIEHYHRSSIGSLQGTRWRLRFHQGTPYRPDEQKAD